MGSNNDRQLKQLAKVIYDKTKADTWLGGKKKAKYHGGPTGSPWPSTLQTPTWSNGVTWSLSPEIELGGHRLRVCVSYIKGEGTHNVRVFADGLCGYPGGLYTVSGYIFKTGWSWHVAVQEARDGGLPGPVSKREDIIALGKGQKVKTQHTEPVYCAICKTAVEDAEAEVEATLNKVKT